MKGGMREGERGKERRGDENRERRRLEKKSREHKEVEEEWSGVDWSEVEEEWSGVNEMNRDLSNGMNMITKLKRDTIWN